MTNDLRAAAERLRRIEDGESPDQAYRAYPSPHLKHYQDMRAVMCAYLAEHPADDGEAVTEEWLREVGFKTCAHWGAMNIGDWHHSMAIEWHGGQWSLTACRQGGGLDFSYDIPALPTRGHVRRLLTALGIPFKEPN